MELSKILSGNVMDKKTYDKGLEVRKAVLGEAYVANALKNSDDFNKPFQELVTEYCWGAIWGREELPRKTRSRWHFGRRNANGPWLRSSVFAPACLRHVLRSTIPGRSAR